MADSFTGETVTYQYDALKRLVSACSTLNNCGTAPTSFQYDGFGNLTSKTLAGVTSGIPVNAGTNQLSNAFYDANGNMTSGAGVTLTYDAGNRVQSASPASGGTEYYGYSAENKRVWRLKADGVTEEWTLYGVRGEKIGVYQWGGLQEHFDNNGNWTNDTASFTPLRTSVWFDGRLVQENNTYVMGDRLGTNRAGGARFLPYGEETSSTTNDRTKFGTYNRDGFTGLDYADQRYYASTYGRFNTADPYIGSMKPLTPSSWNRYSYVQGDPVNFFDSRGTDLAFATAQDCDKDPDQAACNDPCQPSADNPAPDPSCYQSPDGGVGSGSDDPPPLMCANTGTVSSPATKFQGSTAYGSGTGFGAQIWINYAASVGTGSYSWSLTQSVANSGTISTTLGIVKGNGIPHNDNLVPGETTASGNTMTFSDQPGSWYPTIPANGATVKAFNLFDSFATFATVTSGDQTVECPTVFWNAIISGKAGRNGQFSGSGSISVTTGYVPVP